MKENISSWERNNHLVILKFGALFLFHRWLNPCQSIHQGNKPPKYIQKYIILSVQPHSNAALLLLCSSNSHNLFFSAFLSVCSFYCVVWPRTPEGGGWDSKGERVWMARGELGEGELMISRTIMMKMVMVAVVVVGCLVAVYMVLTIYMFRLMGLT